MRKFFTSLLDLIYKKKCYFCGQSKHSLKMCPKCYDKLEFTDFNANRIIEGVNIYCAGMYNKELQKLIRGLKYHNQKELAYYQAKFMFDYYKNINEMQNKDFIIIPVPLHKNRTKQRKYNHMELVCEEFAKISGFPCDFNLITRIKDTKPQYRLNRTERQKNLQNAFQINIHYPLNGKVLLLFDDICTTGSTFEEIIKELKKNKINQIICFATSTPI